MEIISKSYLLLYNSVNRFTEKAKEDGGWINGGFMVLEPEIFNYLTEDDDCIFEQDPMKNIASDKQINAYKHTGFWQCMDTQRDKNLLEDLWTKNMALWKKW